MLQEAAREHDKALRQARAKLQRAEGEARAAKQAAASAAARVQEVEAAAALKDVQLDAAVQQVVGRGAILLNALPSLLSGKSLPHACATRSAGVCVWLQGCKLTLVALLLVVQMYADAASSFASCRAAGVADAARA